MENQKQPSEKILNRRIDMMHSTYYWLMHFDMNHPQNSVPTMTGYSMFDGHPEPRDKMQLLMKKIIMLQTTREGYLQKSDRIEIFGKRGEILVKNQSIHLVTLRRKDCTIENDKLKQNAPFVLFLDKFYRMLKTGENVRSLIPHADTKWSKDDYLKPEKQYARIGVDEMKLNVYCTRLMANGHSFAAANAFCNKYKEMFFTSQNPPL